MALPFSSEEFDLALHLLNPSSEFENLLLMGAQLFFFLRPRQPHPFDGGFSLGCLGRDFCLPLPKGFEVAFRGFGLL
jgi:hypothetical protein